jgi:hypothetical protein
VSEVINAEKAEILGGKVSFQLPVYSSLSLVLFLICVQSIKELNEAFLASHQSSIPHRHVAVWPFAATVTATVLVLS